MDSFLSRVGFPYWLTWQILRGIFIIYHRITVDGDENVPETGGCILASNHLSHWDSFAIGVTARRTVKFVADKRMYDRWLYGQFLKHIGGVPLTRGEHKGEEMIEIATKVIGDGDMILIYPEGTRSRSGVPGRSRTGMIVIAERTGAPIVPCRVSGTSQALPIGKGFARPAKLHVSYGPPITFKPGEIDLDDREKMMLQAEMVMDKIISLPGEFPPNSAMTEQEWWDERRDFFS